MKNKIQTEKPRGSTSEVPEQQVSRSLPGFQHVGAVGFSALPPSSMTNFYSLMWTYVGNYPSSMSVVLSSSMKLPDE